MQGKPAGRSSGARQSRKQRDRNAQQRRLKLVIGVVAALMIAPGAVAQASTWAKGDVFAGIGGGVKVYDNGGNFKEEVSDGTGSSTTGGCGFDANKDLYSTTFQGQKAVQYDFNHPHPVIGDFASQSDNADPESLVFDQAGNFYVGHADGAGDVEKHNSSGAFVRSFDVQTQNRGSDWVELAADQKTLFYASEGSTIFRYDVSTDTQLAPFATGIGSNNFALRLLPPGDGSGGLLVASFNDVKRLDGSGNVVQTYDAPGEDSFFALNLDPNGTSFWTGGISTGDLYRFNMSTGAIEVGPVDTMPNGEFAGLCVLGEPTAAVPPPPPPGPPPGDYSQYYADCPSTIDGKFEQGDNADNTIIGTPQNDLLLGGGGRDTIDGLPGDDCIFGQDGDDNTTLVGSEGNDFVSGGNGDDSADGSAGDDTMFGDAGSDEFTGDGGDDTIDGGTDPDDLDGADDDDRVIGRGANDRVNGGSGRDRVQGSGGRDRVNGDEGKDTVRGGTDNDKVKGGPGNDLVQSQGGRDKIAGGTGNDNIRAGGGDDKVDAVDGFRDKVKCGLGFDKAKVDKKDRVAKDCNKVKVKKAK